MQRKYTVLAYLVLSGLTLPVTCAAQQAKPCPPPTLSVAGGSGASTQCGGQALTLASQYPGDVGIGSDPSVVWAEGFEEGSVSAVTARYDDVANMAGISLSSDKPPKSSGSASLRLVSSGSGANATHLYKNLDALSSGDEWYVRYYVKYEAGIAYHHTSVWFGGYNPPLGYPFPHAGEKPNGDDRFSVAIELLPGASVHGQLDFYNYWMKMHSGAGTYYGNSIMHDTSAVETDDEWLCVEMHVKLNTDMNSDAGAEIGLWLNDRPVKQYTPSSPLGYWIQDKYCPAGTTDPQCTDYYSSGIPMVPLDMQFRSTTALKLNYLWLQNYITASGVTGSVWYDDVVVATRRIGCIQ